MVLNYNLFQAGRPLKAGTLHILEQIPGYTMSDDVTYVHEDQIRPPSRPFPLTTCDCCLLCLCVGLGQACAGQPGLLAVLQCALL